MHGQPARCMNAKLSLTTAYAKLGRSYTDKKSCLYMSIKLSKLMLNPLCSNPRCVIFAPCSQLCIQEHSCCFSTHRYQTAIFPLLNYLGESGDICQDVEFFPLV